MSFYLTAVKGLREQGFFDTFVCLVPPLPPIILEKKGACFE